MTSLHLLDSEIEKLAQDFACASDTMSPTEIRTVVASNAVRYAAAPVIQMGHVHCEHCNEVMSVMMMRSDSINILSYMTHHFHDGSLHLKSGVDQLTAEVLLCTDAVIHFPMFIFNITEYQRGFLKWLDLHIASEPSLRAQHKKWKIEKRMNLSTRTPQFSNICDYCDQPMSDIALLTSATSPFEKSNYAPERTSILTFQAERPLFLKGNLHPVDYLDLHQEPSKTSQACFKGATMI